MIVLYAAPELASDWLIDKRVDWWAGIFAVARLPSLACYDDIGGTLFSTRLRRAERILMYLLICYYTL